MDAEPDDTQKVFCMLRWWSSSFANYTKPLTAQEDHMKLELDMEGKALNHAAKMEKVSAFAVPHLSWRSVLTVFLTAHQWFHVKEHPLGSHYHSIFSKRDMNWIEQEFLEVLAWQLNFTEDDILAHHSPIANLLWT